MPKIKLMSHLIADFPNRNVALVAADALIAGGATTLEIQLPFSDPSADGNVIADACTKVLQNGYKTESAFEFIKALKTQNTNVPIALMSYASLIFTPGVENFCKKAKQAGADALIVPDLPFDCDENLRKIAQDYAIQMIPVAAPSMSDERIALLLQANFSTIYAALRRGITGSQTQITDETRSFLKALQTNGAKILGGFGVSCAATARAIAPFVDEIVAGSVFVKIIAENQNDVPLLKNKLTQKAKELSNFTER